MAFLIDRRVSLLIALLAFSQVASAITSLIDTGPAFVFEFVNLEQADRLDTGKTGDKLRELIVEHRKIRFGLLEDPPEPLQQVRRERDMVRKYLRSRGYYDAVVSLNKPGPEWVFRIDPGALYTISQIDWIWPEGVRHPESAAFGLRKGAPLQAESILEAQKSMERAAETENCLLEVRSDYRVVLDQETQSANVSLRIFESPQVRVRSVSLEGLESIEEPVLRKRLELKPGDCFKRQALNRSKTNLLKSNLIASVNEQLSLSDDETEVDIRLNLTERNHRTVKAGVGFSTDERFTVKTGWEHRNLLHGGERFDVDLTVGTFTQKLESELILPQFGADRQVMTLSADLNREDRDTYFAKDITLGAILSREVNAHWLVSGGVEFKVSEVEDEGEEESYALLSFPLSVTHSTADNLLDPTRGWVVTGQVIPTFDTLGSGTRYIKLIGSGSLYFTQEDWSGSPTLALRAASGILTGALGSTALLDIPSDERYYVGGGGSVRGYEYQSISELDEDEEALGGRSFTEFASELRLRHGSNWGTVYFVDAGYAFASVTPEGFGDLLMGAGFGIRYYTSFAPIRFDIAWPLDRRDDVDDIYQIYLNIGQAF